MEQRTNSRAPDASLFRVEKCRACWVFFESFLLSSPHAPIFFCFLPKLFSPFRFSYSSSTSSAAMSAPPPAASCPSSPPPAVPFLLPPAQPHSLSQTLSSGSVAVFSPLGCFLLFPHPRLLRRVAYQSPQCHDSKGSGRHSCPCHSGSHQDQVTKRGCEPVLLIWF